MYSVYILVHTSPTLDVKIGYSKDIEKRKIQLQTGCSYSLELWGVKSGLNQNEALRLESEMHAKYKDYRLQGEWFDNDVLQKIASDISSPFFKNRSAIHRKIQVSRSGRELGFGDIRRVVRGSMKAKNPSNKDMAEWLMTRFDVGVNAEKGITKKRAQKIIRKYGEALIQTRLGVQ